MLHRAGAEKLVVVHLDHRLRGRASTADARFVQKLAQKYGYPAHIAREDVKTLAADQGVSLELAARRARHTCFAEAARVHRTNRVYLGHHADDQAETILQNLFRGTGPAGLCGMSEETPLRVGRRTLTLLRPLLGTRRSEIEAYAAEHTLKHREDASNTSRAHARNRIRHDLLPAAAQASGRDPVPAILRAFGHLRDDTRFLEEITRETAQTVFLPDSKLSAPALRACPLPVARRIVKMWLQNAGISGVNASHITNILALTDPSGLSSTNLPGGKRARRRARVLFIDSQ